MSTPYVTSGSAFERVLLCRSSVALPHADFESSFSERGTVIHKFLEDVSTFNLEEALAQTPEDYRDVCSSLNLDGLDQQLSLAAEVAIAYNPLTDTARELGRGKGRFYHDVGEDELPCTVDVVGTRQLKAIRRGKGVDWKSGFRTRRRIGEVTQMDFSALAISRCYGCEIVDMELIHVNEDAKPWIQAKTFESFELDMFASVVREVHEECLAERARYAQGIIPTSFSTGDWCRNCPAREFCPAQTSLLRSVLSKDLFDGPMRMSPIPDDVLVDLWHQIDEAQSVISMLKHKVLGAASHRTLYLGRTPDGKKDRWLGRVIDEGNEKLDGEIVFDVVQEKFGEDVANKATTVSSSKKQLREAIKGAVPRGKLAENERELHKILRERGGISAELKDDVKEWSTKVDEPPPLPTSDSKFITDTCMPDEPEPSRLDALDESEIPFK